MNAAGAVPKRTLSRRSAIRHACRSSGIATWSQDLQTVRGRCQHGRCKGRWGIVRVSLDFTSERVDRLALLECASCGRVWRRVSVPPLRSPAGYQAVRLTLILPRSSARRWRSRGVWHRDGADQSVLRDADLGDLDEAATAHTKRADRLADLRAARKRKVEAETAALMARFRAVDEAAAIRRAEREADEAAALAREKGGLA